VVSAVSAISMSVPFAMGVMASGMGASGMAEGWAGGVSVMAAGGVVLELAATDVSWRNSTELRI
jgi:hypothetical protein